MLTRHNNLKISKGEIPRNLHGIGHSLSSIEKIELAPNQGKLVLVGRLSVRNSAQMVMKNKKVLEFLAFVWITSAEASGTFPVKNQRKDFRDVPSSKVSSSVLYFL